MTRIKPISTTREDVLELVYLLPKEEDQLFLKQFIIGNFTYKVGEGLPASILAYKIMLEAMLKERSIKKRTELVRVFTEVIRAKVWTQVNEKPKSMSSSIR